MIQKSKECVIMILVRRFFMLEFAGRFSDPKLMVKQGKYWSIIFRESTTTLGNCIIILNRECPTFSELKPEEMSEFPTLCAWYEGVIKKLYGAVKFNYLAMMMKEEFVHFHIIPRYDKPIEKYGVTWIDEDWPKGTKMGRIEVSDEVKLQILNDLKNS